MAGGCAGSPEAPENARAAASVTTNARYTVQNLNFSPELNDARAAARTSDLPEIRRAEIAFGIAERRRVRHVVRLGPELERTSRP